MLSLLSYSFRGSCRQKHCSVLLIELSPVAIILCALDTKQFSCHYFSQVSARCVWLENSIDNIDSDKLSLRRIKTCPGMRQSQSKDGTHAVDVQGNDETPLLE
jgi:hypothetical protein